MNLGGRGEVQRVGGSAVPQNDVHHVVLLTAGKGNTHRCWEETAWQKGSAHMLITIKSSAQSSLRLAAQTLPAIFADLFSP